MAWTSEGSLPPITSHKKACRALGSKHFADLSRTDKSVRSVRYHNVLYEVIDGGKTHQPRPTLQKGRRSISFNAKNVAKFYDLQIFNGFKMTIMLLSDSLIFEFLNILSTFKICCNFISRFNHQFFMSFVPLNASSNTDISLLSNISKPYSTYHTSGY